MFGFIYITKCLVKEYYYVGQKRFNNRSDRTYLGSGYILKALIAKHGKNNFIRETLCNCDSQKELDEKEIFWIKKYKEDKGKKCINIALGGLAGGSPILNHPNKKEIIRKISETNKKFDRSSFKPMLGKTHSEQSKNKMSKSAEGRIPHNKGKKMSQDFRNKCSANKKGQTPWNKGRTLSKGELKNHKGFEKGHNSPAKKSVAKIDPLSLKILEIYSSVKIGMENGGTKDCYNAAKSNLAIKAGNFYWIYTSKLSEKELINKQTNKKQI